MSLPKALATGTLPTSKTTIYTVPTGKIIFVGQIIIHNTSATPQTIIFWVTRGGVEVRIKYITALPLAWTIEFGFGIVLSAADTIAAISTTTSAAGYLLSGAELP